MNYSPNLFAGEYVLGVNTKAAFGGDSTKFGLWRIQEAFEDKAIIKKFAANVVAQVGNLCSTTPQDNSTLADLVIQLENFHFDQRVCKHDFDDTSFAMYQQKGIRNKTIPTELIQAYIEDMASDIAEYLEDLRWCGDVTATGTTLSAQDGIITQLIADGTYITPTGVTDPTDSATVLADLGAILKAVPAKIKQNPDFKILVSPEVWSAYEEALLNTGQMNVWLPSLVGLPNGAVGKLVGRPYPVYVIQGFSISYPSCVMAGIFADNKKGNLVFATDALSDANEIVVQDRQKMDLADPFMDFIWGFRQGISVVRPEEVTMYI